MPHHGRATAAVVEEREDGSIWQGVVWGDVMDAEIGPGDGDMQHGVVGLCRGVCGNRGMKRAPRMFDSTSQ